MRHLHIQPKIPKFFKQFLKDPINLLRRLKLFRNCKLHRHIFGYFTVEAVIFIEEHGSTFAFFKT